MIVCFAISYSQAFIGNTTFFAQIFMTLIFAPAILSMIFIQINGFTKLKKHTKLILISKIFGSIFTFFFILIFAYVQFFIQKSSLWMLLIPLWMFLFAIYEFITRQKTDEIDYKSEIDEIGNETQL